MPRYFFDIHDGVDIVDEEGVECADLEAARVEAIRTAGEMLSEKGIDFWTGKPWTMKVRDASGNFVSELSFTAT